jgi:hypothetical protein
MLTTMCGRGIRSRLINDDGDSESTLRAERAARPSDELFH